MLQSDNKRVLDILLQNHATDRARTGVNPIRGAIGIYATVALIAPYSLTLLFRRDPFCLTRGIAAHGQDFSAQWVTITCLTVVVTITLSVGV
jgi:hypothetical protein